MHHKATNGSQIGSEHRQSQEEIRSPKLFFKCAK